MSSQENDGMTTTVREILELVGAFKDNDSKNQAQIEKEQLYALFEAWLGLQESDEIETCFEDGDESWNWNKLSRLISNLLVQGWTPLNYSDGGVGTLLVNHHNALLEQLDYSPDQITLKHVFHSVQVTIWFNAWIDLSMPVGEQSLITSILKLDDDDLSNQHSYRVLDAFFAHVEYMPILQAQIYQYAQSLKKPTNSASHNTTYTTQLIDPASRLHQYEHAQQVTARLEAEWQQHTDRVQRIMEDFYIHADPETRSHCRHHLGRLWSLFLAQTTNSTGSGGVRQENTKAAYLSITLHLLYRILLGIGNKLSPAHHHLLSYHLIPLHKPDALVLWRDQTSMLELYHSVLVQCIAILLQKQPDLLPTTVLAILKPEIFPLAGNTPKQVLLLHEIDTYLGLMDINEYIVTNSNDDDDDVAWLTPLWTTVSRCMNCDHSRVAQRALTMFQNTKIVQLVQRYPHVAMKHLLPALVRRGEPSWNPTVRKMTYNVLKKLLDIDKTTFAQVCQEIEDGPVVHANAQSGTEKKSSPTNKHITPQPSAPAFIQDYSLKAGMGGWRPPSNTRKSSASPSNTGTFPPPTSSAAVSSSHSGSQPPLTVTGVAPWAKTNASTFQKPSHSGQPPLTVTGVAPWASRPSPNVSHTSKTTSQPPLTVTGVAPWANSQAVAGQHKRPVSELLPKLPEKNSIESKGSNSEDNDGPKNSLDRVLEYMNKLKPPEEDEGASFWSKAQMAETPTLLPNLKFHDLVFGHDLGTGAFGSVRYARLIDRTKTRSHWPEYAVKIISTEKIREMGYEASVQREIAVLRLLSHPGIARLISSFRFREGAYLVLEYASGGDLHTLLQKHGSLDHDSTRFVIGEVVAALVSIHESGLVYADLKPENVVITELGHIKLTDFGGCRPVTPEAIERVRSIARNLLQHLRDGDWKEENKSNKSDQVMYDVDNTTGRGNDDKVDCFEEEDDIRVEGTTAYLPPEVVMGAYPTFAADSWALGCVLYQCLTGRPPLMELDDTATRNRIVNFDIQDSGSEIECLFQDKHASGVSAEARELIGRLLDRDVSQRMDIQQAAQHDFFSNAGMNVFDLHSQTAYPLDIGSVEPEPDAQWSRRQFSSIWAPQPKAYNVKLPDDQYKTKHVAINSEGPIAEGGESNSFFSTSKNLPQDNISSQERFHIPRPVGKA